MLVTLLLSSLCYLGRGQREWGGGGRRRRRPIPPNPSAALICQPSTLWVLSSLILTIMNRPQPPTTLYHPPLPSPMLINPSALMITPVPHKCSTPLLNSSHHSFTCAQSRRPSPASSQLCNPHQPSETCCNALQPSLSLFNLLHPSGLL